MKKAIVTLAIGKSYEAQFEKYCRFLWSLYTEKHGLDLIVITEHLDNSLRAQSRSAAWQKCLIFSDPRVQNYDQVVWVDADVLINPNSPDITLGVPLEKIGVVDEAASPSKEEIKLYVERFNKYFDFGTMNIPAASGQDITSLHSHAVTYGRSKLRGIRPQEIEQEDAPMWYMIPFLNFAFNPSGYYNDFGLNGTFESIVQTGVMVLSRSYHKELLEHVYYNYEDKGPDWHFEQRPLGYEILKQKQEFWMSPKFNMVWVHLKGIQYPFLDFRWTRAEKVLYKVGIEPRTSLISQCLTASFFNNYFLHFAGGQDAMRYVNVGHLI
jgi:hypothetical protein